MNIKDFLIDNYIWILVIILITIITIIGFLADKKKTGKKNQKTHPTVPNSENLLDNNVPPMQYTNNAQNNNQMNNHSMNNINSMNLNNQVSENLQPMNQQPNMLNSQNFANVNNSNPNDGEPQTVSTMPMPTNVNTMNNPQPVENITPTAVQEPMYQPLSEQKPNIPPQPVQNFSNISNNNQEIPQQINNGLNQNNTNAMPIGVPLQPTVEQPMMQNQYNTPTPMTQPMPNYNQSNTTVPSPVNPIPTPQPVNPQPIMPNPYNNMPQSNYGGGMQQQPNTQPMNQPSQQAQTTTPQPINFVFGPQNNNQNM